MKTSITNLPRAAFPVLLALGTLGATTVTSRAQEIAIRTSGGATVSGPVAAATTPAVIPSAVFTGIVKQVVDARTLLIARDTPPAVATIHSNGNPLNEENTVPVRLYGVQPATTSDAEARQFLQQLTGKHVRIEVRGGTSESPRAVRSALVYTLPDPGNGGPVSAPPALAEQKSPSIAVVPTRTADATNTSPDMLRGPVQPNIPTASSIPIPPPSSQVRSDDCVNIAYVRQGLGRWDNTAAPNDKPLSDAQKEAQKGKRGVWSVAGK